jgi:hypothetical protein
MDVSCMLTLQLCILKCHQEHGEKVLAGFDDVTDNSGIIQTTSVREQNVPYNIRQDSSLDGHGTMVA